MSSVKGNKKGKQLVNESVSRSFYKSKSLVATSDSTEAHAIRMQEKCKKYYRESYQKYKNFFSICLREIEDLQPNAFACIQISRYFTSGVQPKYCHIPDPLTPKQRQRVERLLLD